MQTVEEILTIIYLHHFIDSCSRLLEVWSLKATPCEKGLTSANLSFDTHYYHQFSELAT